MIYFFKKNRFNGLTNGDIKLKKKDSLDNTCDKKNSWSIKKIKILSNNLWVKWIKNSHESEINYYTNTNIKITINNVKRNKKLLLRH